MYAIIETGSKQYKVSKGDRLEVEKLELKDKKETVMDKVLFISDEKAVSIGKPYLESASVVCDVIGDKKSKKVISFKYRRRHGSSKRMVGHRQNYTVLQVKDIKGGLK